MDLKLQNKRALVLGASQGIGKAIAAQLVKEGANVCIASRNADKLENVAREIGAHASVAVDLGQPQAATQVVTAAAGKLGGGIDILIFNTGGPPKGTLHSVTDSQWSHAYQNLWMAFLDSMRAVVPGMRAKSWGRIVVITSTSAKEALPEMTISNGMRAGMHGMVKSFASELGEHGITVNALMPGFIDTERLKELGIKPEAAVGTVPVGRFGRPEEMAAVATFLVSEPASYLTGQAIAVDGGRMRGI